MTALSLASVSAVNSYFAIYTLEKPTQARMHRGFNWDLHATATDKTMAISHARMLALQPGVSEVQVKQVTECPQSGEVHVRNIKRCKRSRVTRFAQWLINLVF
jgi:hypothetical protein